MIKRVLAMGMAAVMMFCSSGAEMGSMAFAVKHENEAGSQITKDKKNNYMILCKDKESRDKIKNKFKDRVVIKHKKADEQYLENDNITNLALSNDERDYFEKKDDVIIEPDKEVSGLSMNRQNPISYEEYINRDEPEYSDDPTEFVPCKPVKGKDANEKTPWNISLVAGQKNGLKYDAKGVKIAVIDSGIDVHDDLATCKWVDFSSKKSGYKPVDNSGHGTEIAGVIAARENGFGIVGIANGAEVYSVKILDAENKANISSVIKAINWCIENDIDVINMSFGMDGYSEILEQIIKQASKKNIVMVAAAGNNNRVQYPAKYEDVISVGGISRDLTVAEYSPQGTDIDIYAPSEEINTTGILGRYSVSSGTSVASAHVAGVMAVIKSIYPKLSNEVLKLKLMQSSVKLENQSAGIVNLKEMLRYCKQGKNKKTDSDRRKVDELDAVLENKTDFVEGSWLNCDWKGIQRSEGTGHYAMINNMSTDYFADGTSNYTQKTKNRWIAADSAYLIDDIIYNKNWESVYEDKNYKYSPYHGNGHYTYSQTRYFVDFLYELARLRLKEKKQLELDYNKYNNKDEYKGVYIPCNMKKSIVRDMKKLYGTLKSHYTSTKAGINMDEAISRGYMVLGVLLHLEADYYCHRSKITQDMIYRSADGAAVCVDRFGSTNKDSSVSRKNFKSKDDYDRCLRYIKKYNGLPINRLKDRLKTSFSIYCGGKTYNVSHNEAYEDNPFFWSNRYAASCYQVGETLKEMRASKKEATQYDFSCWDVYTYDEKFEYQFEHQDWVEKIK